MSNKFDKKEIESYLNEVLGVQIRWSKLSQNELVQLYVLFSNPEVLRGVIRRMRKKEGFSNKIQQIIGGKIEQWLEESDSTAAMVIREAKDLIDQ